MWRLAGATALCACGLLISACEEQQSAQKVPAAPKNPVTTGQDAPPLSRMDQAKDAAREAGEAVSEKAGQALEATKQMTDEALKVTKDAAESAAEVTGEALKKAGAATADAMNQASDAIDQKIEELETPVTAGEKAEPSEAPRKSVGQ